MVFLNGYTQKNAKKVAVSFEYMRSLSGTLDLENLFEWLFWHSCRQSNRHELSGVEFKLMRVWGDVRFTQWTRKDQCSQKGGIFKELVILLAASVHGWINTCFVCCLHSRSLLLTQEAIADICTQMFASRGWILPWSAFRTLLMRHL